MRRDRPDLRDLRRKHPTRLRRASCAVRGEQFLRLRGSSIRFPIEPNEQEPIQMSEAHPLTRHPRYGVPCPPQPDFGPPVVPRNEGYDEQIAKKMAFFATVIEWMLVNYAYREGADKDGVISLVTGEILSLQDLKGRMAPWAMIYIGQRRGIN